MEIIFIPEAPGNPYQQLLARELAKMNVFVKYRPTIPTQSWLLKSRKKFQVMHFHWPSCCYQRRGSFLMRAISLFRFAQKLLLVRMLGIKIIWTVHNILPHEQNNLKLDRLARFIMVAFSHSIIVHCDYARRKIRQLFYRKKNIYIVPHGNYVQAYPPGISKEAARAKLKIDNNAFVYLFFGQIRPYKGVELLIEKFKTIKDVNAVLIIAGKCVNMQKTELLNIINGSSRIRLFEDVIPEKQIPLFFSAADCFVAPFSDILTSGSVILGLSFGLPVVAPAIGCLPELINEDVGVLYKSNNGEGLLVALKKIKGLEINNMQKSARAHAQRLSWFDIAKKTYRIYK